MKLFKCQCCGQVLHFENSTCLRCGRAVGYQPETDRMVAVEPDGPLWRRAVGDSAPNEAEAAQRWRFCINWEMSACNWMVECGVDGSASYCAACQHNRTIPDLSLEGNLERWLKIEAAKRRLIYSLIQLELPLPVPGDAVSAPLIFDFKDDVPGTAERVLTGHANGVVTIALIEADDAAREQMRADMGEAYRTLLGHFRHEVGHYYWDLLIRDGGYLQQFRAMFGDEREDYTLALQRHYEAGPAPDWSKTYVSAYATMHAWEDWAETWAHYMHMVDTLETAAAFGMTLQPEVDETGQLSAELDFDPAQAKRARQLMSNWMPLTVALNALNRSMGQRDLYPFTLPNAVREKLAFVHDLIHGRLRPDGTAQ